MNEGTKQDQEKIRMDLLPMDALYEVAKVLTFGSKKYGDKNWEQGIALWRLRGAKMRHDTAYELGESLDPESGLIHKAHEACNVLMELALILRGKTE